MKRTISILCVFLLLTLCACTPVTQKEATPPTSEAVTEPTQETTLPASKTEPEILQETGPDTTVSEDLPANTITTKYYTLTLPETWKDKCIFEIVDKNDGTYNLNLYELTSHMEMDAGKLCALMLIPTSDDTYKDFPSYELLCALDTPNGSFYVIALFPTDVQFNENTMDTYNAMYNELMDVLYTIWPADGIEMAMA